MIPALTPDGARRALDRFLDGPADDVAGYSESVVAPSNPNEVTYGTAFVNDANLTADTIGAITSIQTIGKGQFSQSAIDDLSDPGRNLLVFIHGFNNRFDDAVFRFAQIVHDAVKENARTPFREEVWKQLAQGVPLLRRRCLVDLLGRLRHGATDPA